MEIWNESRDCTAVALCFTIKLIVSPGLTVTWWIWIDYWFRISYWVKIVSYTYLGIFFHDHLKFHVDTDFTVKRGQKRIHLLRKLNSFSVRPVTLCQLYWEPHVLFFTHVFQLRTETAWLWNPALRDLNSFCKQQILQKAEWVSSLQVKCLCCLQGLIMSDLCTHTFKLFIAFYFTLNSSSNCFLQ